MGMTMIGAGPALPITMFWDGEYKTYESLRELGIDLEYIDFEYESNADRPIFTDARGATFRIIVLSLEVVLCARVPDDYDPSHLKLVTFKYEGSEFVVEALGTQPHRALSCSIGENKSYDAVPPEDLELLSPLLYGADLATPSMRWRKFNEVWNTCVDPSLPIDLADLIPKRLRRLFRKHS